MHEVTIHADQGTILVCLFGIARTLVMRVAYPEIWSGFEDCSREWCPVMLLQQRTYDDFAVPKGGFFGHSLWS